MSILSPEDVAMMKIVLLIRAEKNIFLHYLSLIVIAQKMVLFCLHNCHYISYSRKAQYVALVWFDSQFFRMTFFPAFLSTSFFVICAIFIQLEIWKSDCCIGPVQNVFIFVEFAQQRSESAELWSRPENSIFHRTPEIWISSAGKSMNFKFYKKPTQLNVNWSWGPKLFQASTICLLPDCQL